MQLILPEALKLLPLYALSLLKSSGLKVRRAGDALVMLPPPQQQPTSSNRHRHCHSNHPFTAC